MVARLPKPAEFRAVFIALGWAGIRELHGVGAVTIKRWIEEEGREDLTAERADNVARLHERDRAFRRRAAALSTIAGIPPAAAARLNQEQQDERLRA